MSEFIEGSMLVEFFNEDAIDRTAQLVASKLIDIFRLFKLAHITHGDTKATNFMVVNDKVFVIDLDAVRFHTSKRAFTRTFDKDIHRFLRNWENQPKIKALFEKELHLLLSN